MNRDELDTALLKAHADNDNRSLITLYTLTAGQAECDGDIDAACFYLTHAFVFALEFGAQEGPALNKKLFDYGRAQLLEF